MAALGLHQLVPASLLAGRWVAVLVCYLDDSGKDPQNSITTVAGYAAHADSWKTFEESVESVFAEYGVDVFHAMHLHHSDGIYDGWSRVKKQTFVREICEKMTPLVPLGVSMSALKSMYKERAAESTRKRTVTAYTFCANVIIDWLLLDWRVGKIANTEGLSLILECGNEHNGEAEQNFYAVREQHKLHNILKSISFVPKDACRAIQMADLVAFYSRRHGVAMERAPVHERASVSPATMMNIIAASVPLRAYVATDFGEKAPGSRFFAGDLPDE